MCVCVYVCRLCVCVCVCVCRNQHRDNCGVICPRKSLCTNCFHESFFIICPSSSPTSFSRRIMRTAIHFTRMGDAVEIFLNDENAVPAKSLY